MTLNETIAMTECMQDVLDALDEMYCKCQDRINQYNDCVSVVSKYTNKQLYIKRLMEYIESTEFSVNDGITY